MSRGRDVLIASIAVAAVAAFAAAAAAGVVQEDFAAYWVAGGIRRLGLDPYVNHAVAGTVPEALWDGSVFHHSRFLYPPLAAELFRPLAALPFRAAKIVNGLLNLSRPGAGDNEHAPVDLNAVITDVFSLLEHQFSVVLAHVGSGWKARSRDQSLDTPPDGIALIDLAVIAHRPVGHHCHRSLAGEEDGGRVPRRRHVGEPADVASDRLGVVLDHEHVETFGIHSSAHGFPPSLELGGRDRMVQPLRDHRAAPRTRLRSAPRSPASQACKFGSTTASVCSA